MTHRSKNDRTGEIGSWWSAVPPTGAMQTVAVEKL